MDLRTVKLGKTKLGDPVTPKASDPHWSRNNPDVHRVQRVCWGRLGYESDADLANALVTLAHVNVGESLKRPADSRTPEPAAVSCISFLEPFLPLLV